MIHEATRTLVKSQPEIWEQCSDPGSLSRHLNGSFGEIRITRLEPESTVAWEGDHGSGTVRIEPSAWGTRVTLTAQTQLDETPMESEAVLEPDPASEPAAELEPAIEPAAEEAPEPAAPDPPPKRSAQRSRDRLTRLMMRVWRGRPISDAEPAVPESAMNPAEPPQPEPEPASAPEPGPPEARQPEPDQVAPPEEERDDRLEQVAPPEEERDDRLDGEAILMAALESMGQAHHRPYSRG